MHAFSLAVCGLLFAGAAIATNDFNADQFNTNLFEVDSNAAVDSPYWWMSKGSPFKRSYDAAASTPQNQRFDFANNPFMQRAAASAKLFSGPGYLPPQEASNTNNVYQTSPAPTRPPPPPPAPTRPATIPCNGNGRVCVPNYLCNNGAVDASQVNGASSQQCNVAANEVCCTVRVPPPPPPAPTRASNEYIPPPRPTPPAATPCLDRSSVCVQAYQCNNGVVQRGNPLAANQPASSCRQPEVCCRIPEELPSPSTARPVIVTQRPFIPPPTQKAFTGNQYIPPQRDNEVQPGGNNPLPSYLPPNGEDEKSYPTNRDESLLRPDRPQTGQDQKAPEILPPIQCPAATNCTEIEFCGADGFISKTPVILNDQQKTFRVPLTDCRDISRGFTGKCCRDADYTDPWPTSLLINGQYDANELGKAFDDGSYKGPKGRQGNSPNGPSTIGGNAILSQPISSQSTNTQYSRTPLPSNTVQYTQAPFNPNAIPNGNKPYVQTPYVPNNPNVLNQKPFVPQPPTPPSPNSFTSQPINPNPVTQQPNYYSQQPQQTFRPQQQAQQQQNYPQTPQQQPQQQQPQRQQQNYPQSPQAQQQQTYQQPQQQQQNYAQTPQPQQQQHLHQPQQQPQIYPQTPQPQQQQPHQQPQQQQQNYRPQPQSQQQPHVQQPQHQQNYPQAPQPQQQQHQQQQHQPQQHQPQQQQQNYPQTPQPQQQQHQRQPQQPHSQQPNYPQTPQSQQQQPQQQTYRPQQQPQKYQPQPQQPQQQAYQPQPLVPSQQLISQRPQNPLFGRQGAQAICSVRDKQALPKGPGPNDAAFGEFPWQAMILRESTKSILCGGAIIEGNIVATAAHCVDGLRTHDVLIKAGEWKLGSTEEPKPFQTRRVVKITMHPAYQPTNLESDVALLHLENNLNFDKHIGPICIDENDIEPSGSANEECVTSGWGKEIIKHHVANQVPKSVQIEPLPPHECSSAIGNFNAAAAVCGRANNNICDADAGSALACTRGDGKYLLKGIYSSESGCGPNQYATFTKMDAQFLKGGQPSVRQNIPARNTYQNQPTQSIPSARVTASYAQASTSAPYAYPVPSTQAPEYLPPNK